MSNTTQEQQGNAEKNLTTPVAGGDVPMVDDAIAVGEDLAFQERWWTFERVTWTLFAIVLVLDVAGVFGGGPAAKARIDDPGLGMRVDYQRVERTGTPSMLGIHFGPDAVVDGTVKLTVSDTLVKDLGAQRVIPQPETSAIVAGGMLYTFAAGAAPGEVDFELSPGSPGVHAFTLQVQGKPAVTRRIVVVP